MGTRRQSREPREQLEWVAAQVREAIGTAGVWLAVPASISQERDLAAGMTAARAVEYVALGHVATEARDLPQAERGRAARRPRTELRRLRRRDFFPPPERDAAVAAVTQLVETTAPTGLPSELTPPWTLR